MGSSGSGLSELSWNDTVDVTDQALEIGYPQEETALWEQFPLSDSAESRELPRTVEEDLCACLEIEPHNRALANVPYMTSLV